MHDDRPSGPDQLALGGGCSEEESDNSGQSGSPSAEGEDLRTDPGSICAARGSGQGLTTSSVSCIISLRKGASKERTVYIYAPHVSTTSNTGICEWLDNPRKSCFLFC